MALVEVKNIMAIKLITSALLLWVAEVLASWSVWNAAPTDTLRVWYPNFWRFEAGRQSYWIVVFACSVLVWIISWYGLHRRVRKIAMGLLGAALAVAVEVLTSVWYWESASSVRVRSLYESIWYWNRVPQPSDIGWPSFWGYLWGHLLPWGAFLLVGLGLWYALLRIMRHFRRNHPAPSPVRA